MMRITMPAFAQLIIDRLYEHDFECFAVGGCVRDSLIGREVNDWDFTTNATPEQIEQCFSDFTTVDIGKRFGTICVVIDGQNFEITTYRTESGYEDSRHPDNVSFSKNLSDDLSRRDFTVNALAYNDRIGLVDEYGGLDDLEYGIIRAIGNPDLRFSEDALRILRALRFSSVLGFAIEHNTAQSILKNKDSLNLVSGERIMKELSKLLCGKDVDLILRRYREVIAVIVPEISVMFDFDQKSLHHNKDLWRHTVSAVKNTPNDEILRTTMLLHDLGKPMTVSTDKKGFCHFHNHPKLSAAMAVTILKRLHYPTAFINTVSTLIEYHDVRLKSESSMIKRCMRDIGLDNTARLLLIQRADILAQSMYKREEKLSTLDAVVAEFERIRNSNECYNLSMLKVNGKDIIHLGVTNGEKIGKVLNTLLDEVIDGNLPNDKNSILLYASTII